QRGLEQPRPPWSRAARATTWPGAAVSPACPRSRSRSRSRALVGQAGRLALRRWAGARVHLPAGAGGGPPAWPAFFWAASAIFRSFLIRRLLRFLTRLPERL